VARQHISLRIGSRDRALLQEHADRTGVSASELVRRYVAEGIRRDRHPRITFVRGRSGGRPTLEGRRLEIATIIETWRANGRDESAVARYHDVRPEDVRAALDYYAEFRAEVDASLEEARRVGEHYEARARARSQIA